MIGRYTTINNQPEVSTLTAGLDFRQPQYRREVFLNFYDFENITDESKGQLNNAN
jgi:hypothetical protein